LLSKELLVYLEIAVDVEGGDTGDSTPPTENNTDDGGEGTEGGEGTPNGEPEEPSFELDGEKYTLQQLKEFRQGYLRQSDYTKKTQEIANQRKQYENAVQLYEYLNSKPQLIEKLKEFDTDELGDNNTMLNHQDPELQSLKTEVMAMKINSELEMLKTKDPNINEVELLDLANKKSLPLSDAYAMWKGQNVDKLIKEALSKQSSKLTEQIKNGQSITTLMNPNEKSETGTYGLSEQEMSMANKLEMSYEEYAKWKK
jgi:hypothetical protein